MHVEHPERIRLLHPDRPDAFAPIAREPAVLAELGGVIARVVDFRVALVRLELPPEAAGPPPAVELLAAPPAPPALTGAFNRPEPGPPPKSLSARLVGAAPQVEPNSQYAAYWYEADTAPATAAAGPPNGLWRPGLFVKAFVPVPGAAEAAVSIPGTALLYHQGRTLVYARVGAGRYERREVRVLGRAGDRCVLAGGVTAGEPVVSKRAQVLLSEEFRGEADAD